MSVLSDRGIQSYITDGYSLVWRMLNKARQPASIDVRLGDSLRVYRDDLGTDHVVDLREPQDSAWYAVAIDDQYGYLLPPGGFALGSTREKVAVPDTLCGFLAGRSGVARIGLQIEAAGLLDPGYEGRPTLELFNQSPFPIRLYAGMPIGQVYFVTLDQAAEVPYGSRMRVSKYQNDQEPIASQMWREAAR